MSLDISGANGKPFSNATGIWAKILPSGLSATWVYAALGAAVSPITWLTPSWSKITGVPAALIKTANARPIQKRVSPVVTNGFKS